MFFSHCKTAAHSYDFYVESVPCTASNAFTAAASDGSATAFKTAAPSSSSSASHHDEDIGASANVNADDDEGESWYASQGKKKNKQATKAKPTKQQRSDIANTESHVPFEVGCIWCLLAVILLGFLQRVFPRS